METVNLWLGQLSFWKSILPSRRILYEPGLDLLGSVRSRLIVCSEGRAGATIENGGYAQLSLWKCHTRLEEGGSHFHQ